MDNFIQKVPLLDLIEMCKDGRQIAKDELYRRWEIDWEELIKTD